MKVVKWGVHGTGTCIGPGILLYDCGFSFMAMYALYQCLEPGIQTYGLTAGHDNPLHFGCRICDCYEPATITSRSPAGVLAKGMSE